MCNMLIYLFTMHNKPALGTYLFLLFCPDTDAYVQFAIPHALSAMLCSTDTLYHYGTLAFVSRVKSRVVYCIYHVHSNTVHRALKCL